MKLGQVIKELREKRGVTPESLAKSTWISVEAIEEIESGRVSPSTWVIGQISEALQVPKEVILFKALEPSDIPEAKQEAFKGLSPAINDLLNQVF